MRELFHGWRRKAGVVALVMALAVFVMWMRSPFKYEGVAFTDDDQQHLVLSMNSGISWWRWESRRDEWIGFWISLSPSQGESDLNTIHRFLAREGSGEWVIPY